MKASGKSYDMVQAKTRTIDVLSHFNVLRYSDTTLVQITQTLRISYHKDNQTRLYKKSKPVDAFQGNYHCVL
jgi:hypothetical protein